MRWVGYEKECCGDEEENTDWINRQVEWAWWSLEEDQTSSDGALKDMGDKSGYSRSATASKWENGGRAFGDDSLSPADGGSGGSGGWTKIPETSDTKPLFSQT
jgi:hypothetical protein